MVKFGNDYFTPLGHEGNRTEKIPLRVYIGRKFKTTGYLFIPVLIFSQEEGKLYLSSCLHDVIINFTQRIENSQKNTDFVDNFHQDN